MHLAMPRAARDLFIDPDYAQTRMHFIVERADVAVQTLQRPRGAARASRVMGGVVPQSLCAEQV